MASKKIKLAEVNSLPTVIKGSHLTVTTHPDGKTSLEWDDEALMRDVREALASVEESKILNSVEVSVQVIEKAKRTSKKKSK